MDVLTERHAVRLLNELGVGDGGIELPPDVGDLKVLTDAHACVLVEQLAKGAVSEGNISFELPESLFGVTTGEFEDLSGYDLGTQSGLFAELNKYSQSLCLFHITSGSYKIAEYRQDTNTGTRYYPEGFGWFRVFRNPTSGRSNVEERFGTVSTERGSSGTVDSLDWVCAYRKSSYTYYLGMLGYSNSSSNIYDSYGVGSQYGNYSNVSGYYTIIHTLT